MRRVISLALAIVFAAVASGTPTLIAQPQTGTVTGTAADPSKNALANHTVRLRNVANGQITSTTTSAANGTFTFAGVSPGNFVIEVVNAAGNIVGTSSAVAVTAGTVATVTVTATALAGAAAAAGAGAAGLAGIFTGTSLIVVTAAGIAGVVIAVQATQDDASPSR